MPPLTLKQRVALLEQKLAAIEAGLQTGHPVKDWRKSVGMFTGDEIMKEICEAALEYRAADRRRTHRKPARKRAT